MGRMLGGVTTGRVRSPLRELVYGVPGIGKTTFAADAPDPIFLGEDGSRGLEVARFPVARSWGDVKDGVGELYRENHNYRTLVLDTADHVATLIEAAICAREGRPSIGDVPYGKGPGYCLDLWRDLLADLEQLQAKKGMNVLLLAHSQVKTFKNPTGDDYDKYAMRLDDKAAALLTGWADSVLFASFDVSVKKGQKKDLKGKAIEVERFLYTTRIPAADAKNRHDLPSCIPLSFVEFSKLLERGEAERTAQLRANLRELVEQIADPAKRARAAQALMTAGDDVKQLRSVASRVSATIADQEQAVAASPTASSAGIPDTSAAAASSNGGSHSPATAVPSNTAVPSQGGASPPAGAGAMVPAPASSTAQAKDAGLGPQAAPTTPQPSCEAGTPPADAAGPVATPGPAAVPPNAPVTLEEVLEQIGKDQGQHARDVLAILQDPKAHHASIVTCVVARLLEYVHGEEVLHKAWKNAGGELKSVKTRRGPRLEYMPMDGVTFSQFWHAEVRSLPAEVKDELEEPARS